MKRNLGIGLLIILNLVFTYIIIWGTILSYGIIVAPITDVEVVNNVTKEVLTHLFLLSVVALALNYLLLRKLIVSKNPLKISLLIVLVSIIIFLPFFLNARHSLLDYQKENARKKMYDNRH